MMMIRKMICAALALCAALVLSAGASFGAERISEAEAREAAFSHAGVAADQVQVVSFGLGEIGGVSYYDIEFVSETTKYDYKLNANTGEIVGFKSKQRPEGRTKGYSMDEDSRAQITPDDAKRIALEHAGVSPGSIHKLQIKRDHEHGRSIYEVEFKSGGYEYEYDIDASTGSIIKWHREWD